MLGVKNAVFSGASLGKLKVITYNILADGPRLALSSRHDYCPMALRVWDGENGRRDRLLRQIEEINADVICLQECTMPLFEEFDGRLNKSPTGWVGVHAISETPEGMLSRNEVGVATFVRKGLDIQQTFARPFREGLENRNITGRTKKRLKSLEDCCLLVRLQDSDGNEIVVGNTHLFWDPHYPNAKLCQASLLVDWMHEFSGDIPAILCGDFNSIRLLQREFVNELPPEIPVDWQECAVYKLLHHGRVNSDHPEHPDTLGRETTIKDGLGPLTSPQRWRSCFPDTTFTTRTPEFTGPLDYIFISPHWECIDRVELPMQDKPEEFPCIPDANHPSDHLPLIVTLARI